MAQYDFVDNEGLRHVIDKIKELYITKASTEEIRAALAQLILDEENRAKLRENSIESRLSDEETRAQREESRIESTLDSKISAADARATEEESRIENILDSEITRAEAREQELSNVDVNLDSKISGLQASKISGVLVNDINVVDENNIARIRLTDFNPNISILVKKRDEFPEIGDNSKLYVDEDTSVIWQWDANNDKYIEAGKFNVLNVTELPEDGDSNVLYIKNKVIYMWAWDGIEGHDKWQEISGQDKELRASLLSDPYDVSSIHIDWNSIYNNPDSYTPAPHNHDDRYYTRSQVDTLISEGPVSQEEMQEHRNAENPHPVFKNTIDGLLNQKASTSMVMGHISNTSNPHAVTKEQVGLGNVDNTSDLEKPVSLLTQAAINSKADYDWALSELNVRLSEDDIVDNLYTHQSGKPLSAEQGTILNESIQLLDSRVQSLAKAFVFKGTVESREYLNLITDPEQGDTYQINSGTESSEDGAVYAWDGNAWIQIIANAIDLSSLVATDSEVHNIIDDYV